MQETETTQHFFPLHEIIEELSQQLGEKYVFPEKAQEIAVNLRQHLDQGDYDDIRDGEALITGRLQESSKRDKHGTRRISETA